MKNIIGILSYNMPSITDKIVEQLKSLVKIKCEYIILDNGSEKCKISKHTTHRIEHNTRLTGGMNKILDLSRNADNVWLCTNDIEFSTEIDPLESMLNKLLIDKTIGCIHPSLHEPVKNYAYKYMVKHPYNHLKTGYTTDHPMVDIICPLYTKKALDLNKWQFDKRFEYGWGIDYDSCYIIRNNGLKIAVDFDIECKHQTSITYDSGNDKEFKNRNEYYSKASISMNNVMTLKYGNKWKELFK